LYERVDAPRLSIHALGVMEPFRNVRIFLNHIASCVPTPSAILYPTSVDDSVHDSGLVPVVAFPSSLLSGICEHVHVISERSQENPLFHCSEEITDHPTPSSHIRGR